jgi:hypothetical protein
LEIKGDTMNAKFDDQRRLRGAKEAVAGVR